MVVNQGRAANIEIHYNTNGTLWPQRGPDIWSHFRLVKIAFSIDDVGERFEYQRSNAVWKEVEQNIQRFRELRAQCNNIQLQVCSTVNVFNVRYLDTVARWINQNRESFNFVYWNMMHDAWYFSIATLPKEAKEKIDQHFARHATQPSCQAEFIRIIDFMNRGADSDGNMLRMKIRDLDRKRGQNLADVAPEFAALINYNYNDADPNAPKA